MLRLIGFEEKELRPIYKIGKYREISWNFLSRHPASWTSILSLD
jgi:hypothetical protein